MNFLVNGQLHIKWTRKAGGPLKCDGLCQLLHAHTGQSKIFWVESKLQCLESTYSNPITMESKGRQSV